MNNEVYTLALKSTLNEIRNVCPDVTSAFIFREDGEIVAGDKGTTEKTMVHIVDMLDPIMEKADTIGGIECLSFEGDNGSFNVSHTNDIYLAIVASEKADLNVVDTVTRVLVPTVLKLVEEINPTLLNTKPSELETRHETPTIRKHEQHIEEIHEEPVEETLEKPEEETLQSKPETESSVMEPPVNQVIVENLGGLLVPSDTVRIDSQILSQWEELYEGTKIDEVELETFDGKVTRCKVKPIKESKYEGKGIIQVPEKIQSTLEVKKGELVRAKPMLTKRSSVQR
jgi:hypothetical protein